MKAFNRILAVVLAAISMVFIGADAWLLTTNLKESGRPYRVEISRIARTIEEKGPDSVDLSACEYVTHIELCGDQFYNTSSDYVIQEIDGRLYRFDYTVSPQADRTNIILSVNIFLGIMAGVMLAVMLYIRQKIIRPFEHLTDVPYELSKGNLSAPIKESKNRFFGRFIWGVDLLRENMEEQKQRELNLQRDKKMLLLSLSHDIKTPLSAIKLYAKALSKGLYDDKEKQLEIAEKISAKTDEIESYISQIITASREDFLSLDVKMGEFYLSELISSIYDYYSEKLKLIHTAFSVENYTNCLLNGDLDRSIEVLQNVIENAVKYGDGKHIAVAFSEEDGCILIAVKNSGCTLNDVELPHVFESFWRGTNAEHIKGSGLGLYIGRQLMRKMNGELFAEIKDGYMTITAVFGKV
ncbi:MAG: HAMP domain-containing histidine kinase [Ruminococcus sp.]|nr:HAMP domain-containing histidine kinase [Ruminococcus sp.]